MSLGAGAAFLLFSCAHAAGAAEPAVEKSAPAETKVLFVIEKGYSKRQPSPDYGIAPIVLFDGKRFLEPPAGSAGEPLPGASPEALENAEPPPARDFARKYYRPGWSYPVFYGAEEIGSATIAGRAWDGTLTVKAKAQLELDGGRAAPPRLLAANFRPARRTGVSRRKASAQEAACLAKLAQVIFKDRGAPPPQAGDGSEGVEAAALAGDGKFELIGHYKAREDKALHDLFVVATPAPDGCRPTMAKYAYFEDYAHSDPMRLLDVIDIDGDGMNELITSGGDQTQGGYMIHKKIGEDWRVLYSSPAP